MAWDDPSPRNRVARPAPRDPGDLGDLAPNMRPGYGGIGRQGYGDDNATLAQLLGRTVVSLAVGALVYLGVHVVAILANAPVAAGHGIAIFCGLIAAALFMRNLSSGASGWRLGDLFGWFMPRDRRAWDSRVQGHWFRRRDGIDMDDPNYARQAAAALTVDIVETAIDVLID